MTTNPTPDIIAFLIFVTLPWAIALAIQAIQEIDAGWGIWYRG